MIEKRYGLIIVISRTHLSGDLSKNRQKESHGGADTEPRLSFSSMVIVMKVVGIDLIKLFRKFKFEKSAVILTGYIAIAGYFFR